MRSFPIGTDTPAAAAIPGLFRSPVRTYKTSASTQGEIAKNVSEALRGRRTRTLPPKAHATPALAADISAGRATNVALGPTSK